MNTRAHDRDLMHYTDDQIERIEARDREFRREEDARMDAMFGWRGVGGEWAA